MLLKGYQKEIFRAECNPNFESLHCFAHLDEDVGDALPFLNAELGGSQFTKTPPSVTFRVQGKLITVHARKIAVNALKDEEEADKILSWLKNQINDVWRRREEIEPSYESAQKPQVFQILKLLPKTNCHECGQKTCMVFAALAADGAMGADDCPPLGDKNRAGLREYLGKFRFD